jgi:hypothetical protein
MSENKQTIPSITSKWSNDESFNFIVIENASGND